LWIKNPYIQLRRIANPPQRTATVASPTQGDIGFADYKSLYSTASDCKSDATVAESVTTEGL